MDTGPPPQAARSGRLRRASLVAAGSLFLGIGIVGIVVPILPTTPFLILAAFCYARSSDRCYRWLMTNRVFGRHLDDYLHGRGVSWKVKVGSLVSLWAVISLSALLFTQLWWVRVLLLLVALGVTGHIVTLKGRGRQRIPES